MEVAEDIQWFAPAGRGARVPGVETGMWLTCFRRRSISRPHILRRAIATAWSRFCMKACLLTARKPVFAYIGYPDEPVPPGGFPGWCWCMAAAVRRILLHEIMEQSRLRSDYDGFVQLPAASG